MKKKIAVNDKMQRRYEYFLTEAAGENFAPDFLPELMPKQMLAMGIFGGKYMTDCQNEFPADWYQDAKLNPNFHDPKLNYFGVNASQPLSVWRQKGWIHPADPRGGFSGIAAITLAGACPNMTSGRSNAGKRWPAISPKSKRIARRAIFRVAAASAKPFCTGPMMRAQSDM